MTEFSKDHATRKKFWNERDSITMFIMERTREKKDGHAYICDILAAYRGWRRVNHLGPSQISINSFARGLPSKYKRKLLHRGRYGVGPARAVLGIVLE